MDLRRMISMSMYSAGEKQLSNAELKELISNQVKKSVSVAFGSEYAYEAFYPVDYIEFTFELSKARCECGAEKARTPGHSTWCPKYEA